MNDVTLSAPDKNGIINALVGELSEENKQRLKQFGSSMFFYDFVHERYLLPRLHKADPKRHRKILNSLLSPVKKSRVLDIACGTGSAMAHIDESNAYTGLDLSYSMLREAVKKAKKKSFAACRFIQGNAEKRLFDHESFDFVFMDTSLHLIPDYQRAIAQISKVLTNGNLFVCSTPVVGVHKEFDEKWKKLAEKNAAHTFTMDDLQNVCHRNGLSFTRCGTNGGLLYFQARKQ